MQYPTTFIVSALVLASIPSSLTVSAADESADTAAVEPAVDRLLTTAMARAGDGTYLYLITEGAEVRLHLGTPAPDSLDVTLNDGTTLVGHDGVLQSGEAQPGAALVVTDEDVLLLAWARGGEAYLGTCSLQGDADRAMVRQSYSAPYRLGPGAPLDAALNPRDGKPVFVGFSPAEEGTIWVARPEDTTWTYEEIAHERGEVRPRVSVSELGVVHVVWRDTKGTVWHLESTDGGPWLRSGGTSHMPEPIGTAAASPALLCVRHQLLVALPRQKGQIEYSLYTGQSWEKNLPLTALDQRWEGDRLSAPQMLLDGRGIPWLFYVNTTGKRKYVYYTRWLGFGWDTIREGRGIFHVTEGFLDNLASIQKCCVPARVRPGSDEFGVLLVNGNVPRPLRAYRFATPAPVARPGTDILFLDMLDVGRSLWTEQVMQTAHKHPDNPLLRPSGDSDTLDSHRVFNGGVVLQDEGLFKAWYTSMNPVGDWFADGGMAWKKMTHLCYATSTDGIQWEKPDLGLYEFKGNTRNNGLDLAASLSSEVRNYHGPIRAMLNPDQSRPSHKYLSVPPGFVSGDGLRWRPQPATFSCPGPKPKWVDFHSVIYDVQAPPSRRWKAYGCMCPNEPPVRRTICYAYSADGQTWIQHPENPIFQPETSSSWDKVHDVGVCKYKGHYVMIYQAGDGYDQHLELAVSRDGEHFVRVHDGQSIIAQGQGDGFDRGLFLPTRPLVLENEIRLYYGAANYRAPDDPPFEFERWKMCQLQMGLATLPTDGWTYIRNTPGKHVGYITTLPMKVEDLKGCVLTVNAETGDDGYLLVELLDGQSDDCIGGYEMDRCDKIDQSGTGQVVSWKGKSGLDNVHTKSVRVRIIFRGRGDGLRLYSIGFRRRADAVAPEPFQVDERLVEESLVYQSSVSHLMPLKAWTGYRPDGKPKPIVVLMHGFGEPILRHGGRRMSGSVRYYALQGLYAIAVDLRGREESSGQRDDGGLEVMDIYDAVQAALRKHPQETDSDCVNIIGWSGGGGNTFSAVTRMPDLFSNAAAFYGITDYGHWANTSYKGALEPNIGGTPEEVPDRYAARNSLLGVVNNSYTNFHFFWDEKETICPVWMDTEYRRIASELGYGNITAHESKETDEFRWLHSGGDRASAVEAERICMPLFTERNNPAPKLAPTGRLMVLGYLMTRRFGTLFGQGNDAVVQLDYELDENEYRFAFQLQTSDPSVLGWLHIPNRVASEVAEIAQNGKSHGWETTPDGHIRIRDIDPNAELTVRFNRDENKRK
jgi:prolyl oligopeptidase family protein